MAHKKLKLEVELETAKAKSQVKGLAAEGGASVATSTPKAADELAKSLDRASKSVADFGEKSKASSQQIAGVVRSFAGLGVGMALAYAGKNMERGTARTAVETAGGAISGASMASAALMAIPGGAVAKTLLTALGAAIGGGKVLFDKKGENDAYAKDFAKREREYADSREWADHFKNLTGADKIDMKADELAATVENISTAIERLNQEEKERIATINEEIKAGRLDAADRERDELATTRAKRSQLESVRDNYNRQIAADKKKKDEAREFRGSEGGTDALQKIGLVVANPSDVTSAEPKDDAGTDDRRRERPANHGTLQKKPLTEALPATEPPEPERRPDEMRPSTGIKGFSFDVPMRRLQEIRFGDFDRTSPAEKTASEASARIDREQLEVLKLIDRHLQDNGGDTSWQ